jgi:hypothetical protein
MTAPAPAPAARPLTASVAALTGGLWLHFRRLPGREERAALLAAARAEPTPPARRKAFVAGCLCTPAGVLLTLSPTEIDKLDALSLDEWDQCIKKAAHLNGFAVLQVIAD